MRSPTRHRHPPICGLVLFTLLGLPGTGVATDPRPPGAPVQLAFEVAWTPVRPAVERGTPPRVPPARSVVELNLNAGRILEVVPVPGAATDGIQVIAPRGTADGIWSVGGTGGGRVRVRAEVPLAATLGIRSGNQQAQVGLVGLLDGPERGVLGGIGPVEYQVERLPWDSIRADLGLADGTAEAGAAVAVDLRFNILTPEPAEVALRCSAELRPLGGGEPAWRQEWRGVVATDSPSPPSLPLSFAAPAPEGTYVLEVRSDWEPLGDPAGTRLGRWLRRRRAGSPTTAATRRLTLAVVHSHPPAPLPTIKQDGAGVEVDAVDLAHPAGHRPTASGRGPLDPSGRWEWSIPDAALDAPAFRDRVRNLIGRSGGDPAILPASDGGGLAWSAVGLRVAHPERPHRLTVSVRAGHPAALGVALVVPPGPAGSDGAARLALDACASGGPVLEGAGPTTFSWPVWPGGEAPVVVLVNRGAAAPVVIGSVALTELADLPPAGSPRDAERSIGLHLAAPRELDRFGGLDPSGRVDPLAQARNLATYLIHAGASSVVLPDGLDDRAARRALGGQAAEDSTGPDRLDLTLRVLARRNCSAWVDLTFDGPLAGLPPADSPEAPARDLARLDRQGRVDGPSYQPIHPAVREAMARRVAEAVRPRAGRSNLLGVLVRLGPGSTLPGGPDMGLDDATYARFVAAAFEPGPAGRVPGRGVDDPARFEVRARFVEAAGRGPWLAWRAREVAATYAALGDAANRAAPGARLAVATPALDAGPAGSEARRVDLAGLGPGQAWRGVGVDLAAWPVGPTAPLVFRTSGLSTDDLAHDLATSPELDEPVAARPGRGAMVGVEVPIGPAAGYPTLTARPMAEGPAGDEPLGHALAALDAQRVFVAATGVAGQEERLRRFARVFTALPTPDGGSPAPRLPSGVVARSGRTGGETVLAMANDSPYPILLEAVLATPGVVPTVDDLARGIRLEPGRGTNSVRVVLELAPFGVTAARIGAPDARLAAVHPYPGVAVLDGMKAQADDLATVLDRLNRLPAAPGGPQRPEPGEVELVSARAPGHAVAASPDPVSPEEAELLNAKRDLRAALTSYREKRYADFARLAGSHWARRVVGLNPPAAATAAGTRDRSGAIRTGNASALPPTSRMR